MKWVMHRTGAVQWQVQLLLSGQKRRGRCTNENVQAKLGTSAEKKRKDYAFRHQLNEKASIIPGCPGATNAYNV